MGPAELAREWLKNCHILDTETTGLGPDAEACEISIIDQDGNIVLDTLIKPKNPIPAEATRIHGITNEMVANAPEWPEIHDQVLQLIAQRPLIIYNAEYDTRIIYQSAQHHSLANQQLKDLLNQNNSCAMLAYAEFYGQWDDYRGQWKWQRLGNAATQQGVIIDRKAHRALADCQMTLGVIASMGGQWCTTMQRLKSKCGCPDCGGSLVQITEPEKCYSTDEEVYYTDYETVLEYFAESTEVGEKVSYFEGEVNRRDHSNYLTSCWQIVESMQENASESAGEFSDGYLEDLSQEKQEELRLLILAWLDKNAKQPSFFGVKNVKIVEGWWNGEDIQFIPMLTESEAKNLIN